MSQSTETSNRDAAGSSLASYQLLGKIARGGMGTVYVARRAGVHGFQRLYAIKLMHEHLADSEEFAQMFLDEARLAARLHHPNVVAIVDIGEVDGRQFVVMDYVEGCSLAQLFKLSPEERPWAAVASIFCDFLPGLHAAHELQGDDGACLNVVHRDVSPQNILIGLDGVSRITDFGIAKAESRMTATRPGLRKGKLAFMAPEQLHDDGLDRRADIFSAGGVLWSALTGEALFAGNSDAATMRNLLQLEVPPPSTVGLKCPDAFDAICLKALERDPDQRFQTAREFADAIRTAALELGSPGSRVAVSEWVSRVAGDKIELRRRAIGEVNSNDSSIQTVPLLVESGTQASLVSVPRVRASVPVAAPTIWERWRMPTVVVLLSVVVAVLLAMFEPDDEPPVQNPSGELSLTGDDPPPVARPPSSPEPPVAPPADVAASLGTPSEPSDYAPASGAPASGAQASGPTESGLGSDPSLAATPEGTNAGPRRRVRPSSSARPASEAPRPAARRIRDARLPEAEPENGGLQQVPDNSRTLRVGSAGRPRPPEESDPASASDVGGGYTMDRNPYLRGQ